MSVIENQIAEQYFSSLNGMTRGIIKQKLEFASLLGGHWDALPAEDQDSLLDEHFIPPHIKQKYNEAETEDDLLAYPVLKIKCGQRIVEDDEGETWQDEHSGPFCWETSSQSEFSFEDDMTCTETVKSRAKDPKRPKSPRLMRPNSTDLSASGNLDRAGSSDFQQLRHIWETHHSVTPDGELPPALTSFLSRSQSSLNADFTGIGYSKRAMSNCSIDSIVEQEDEGTIDEPDSAAKTLPSVLKKNTKSTPEPARSTPELSKASATVGKTDTPIPTVAPLAIKEDDNDITGSMKDDIIKMSEIQTKLKETLSEEPIKEQKPSVAANQTPDTSKATNEKPAEKEDILAKFGVTFGYSTEEKRAVKPADKEVETTSEANSEALPSSFDFLSAW